MDQRPRPYITFRWNIRWYFVLIPFWDEKYVCEQNTVANGITWGIILVETVIYDIETGIDKI